MEAQLQSEEGLRPVALPEKLRLEVDGISQSCMTRTCWRSSRRDAARHDRRRASPGAPVSRAPPRHVYSPTNSTEPQGLESMAPLVKAAVFVGSAPFSPSTSTQYEYYSLVSPVDVQKISGPPPRTVFYTQDSRETSCRLVLFQNVVPAGARAPILRLWLCSRCSACVLGPSR